MYGTLDNRAGGSRLNTKQVDCGSVAQPAGSARQERLVVTVIGDRSEELGAFNNEGCGADAGNLEARKDGHAN